MTFNPNADVSNNRARRGARSAGAVGGGIAGLGVIGTLLVALLTGGSFDLSQLLGAPPQTQTQTNTGSDRIEGCETGADANANDACRLAAAQLSLDQFWNSNVEGYVAPGYYVIDGQVQTPCGTASNAVGPFYCPSNQSVYVDPGFFTIMQKQFGASAGNLAQLYVVGHEWGHHIQNIIGTMSKYPNNGTGEDSNGVKMELQADCYAGAWIKNYTDQTDANGVPYLIAPTGDEIRDALNAAAAVGDDNIQSRSGYVNPDSWTHGSSEERQFWFATGYDQGIGACDTF